MNQVNLFLLALVCVYGFFGMWAFVVHEFPVEGPKPTAHARLIVDKLLLWFCSCSIAAWPPLYRAPLIALRVRAEHACGIENYGQTGGTEESSP